MPSNRPLPTQASAKHPREGAGLAITAVAAALTLLGAFLASGDAHAQSGPVDLGSGELNVESAISVSGQVSVVWRGQDAGISAAVSNFSDHGVGADATADHVFETLQKTAITTLGQAAATGALSGHVDVIATVYRFDASGGAINNWAPVGVFINTTDMAIGDDHKANFHTRVQFIPDASRQVQADAGDAAIGR